MSVFTPSSFPSEEEVVVNSNPNLVFLERILTEGFVLAGDNYTQENLGVRVLPVGLQPTVNKYQPEGTYTIEIPTASDIAEHLKFQRTTKVSYADREPFTVRPCHLFYTILGEAVQQASVYGVLVPQVAVTSAPRFLLPRYCLSTSSLGSVEPQSLVLVETQTIPISNNLYGGGVTGTLQFGFMSGLYRLEYRDHNHVLPDDFVRAQLYSIACASKVPN